MTGIPSSAPDGGPENGGDSRGGTPAVFPRAFAAELPFVLSDYQQQALEAMAVPEQSVIVVAPTGSGKSVVADAAIWQALTAGATAAYVSPLRALANQRFDQLAGRWQHRAGLVTGDSVVRPDAPCLVMTAELFRTVALLPDLAGAADAPGEAASVPADARTGAPVGAPADLPAGAPHDSGGSFPRLASAPGRRPPGADPFGAFLRRLGWAVFDEAHYLADPQRGSAWEEAILATPPACRILCLSATIGDPQRLVQWLRWLGRPATLVEATTRPVPLRHYLYLRQDLHLVLDERGERAARFPFAGGWALARRQSARGSGGPPGRRRAAPMPNLPTVAPDEWIRQEAVAALHLLRERGLTPAIAFVPSRREAERLADAARAAFPDAAAGAAVHHAGLGAEQRRRVEERLRSGALWLVCGTTTLAAGLDVPARSVLLTSFGRWDGREFVLLSPAEYRQLTGRAGRLGKDELGAAVLLASPWHSFEEAFGKLTRPLPPVQSAFRLSYAAALAWWSGGPAGQSQDERERRLAAALSSTLDAFLRRSRGGRDFANVPAPAQPDGPAVIQARAVGRLLLLDGLVAPDGRPTARGTFVVRVGGGAEGRLLLRLLEEGGFDGLDGAGRAGLLAVVAEGSAEAGQDAGIAARCEAALRRQVQLERDAGAPLSSPVMGPASRADEWRRRQAAADLLERAMRAFRHAGIASPLDAWGPAVLASLRAG